jgi:hypothetical protein
VIGTIGLSLVKGLVELHGDGWGQPEDKDRAMAAGFDRHLTKPVHPHEIEKLLAALPGGIIAAR